MVRGMADACLAALGVPATALGVGELHADLLDAWLVDDAADGDLDGTALAGSAPGRGRVLARPLLMSDRAAAAALAGAALETAWPSTALTAEPIDDPRGAPHDPHRP